MLYSGVDPRLELKLMCPTRPDFRWSGGGGLTDGSNDRSGGGLDEEVGLLHGAAEVPFESPLPYRSVSNH